jgi:hypothetical protein
MRRKACISTSFQVAGPQLLQGPTSVRESSLGMPALRDNALGGEPPRCMQTHRQSKHWRQTGKRAQSHWPRSRSQSRLGAVTRPNFV